MDWKWVATFGVGAGLVGLGGGPATACGAGDLVGVTVGGGVEATGVLEVFTGAGAAAGAGAVTGAVVAGAGACVVTVGAGAVLAGAGAGATGVT
jgi:hypothetical protein